MLDIRIKRVYDPTDPQDGLRVLVDRLWPRGFTREKLGTDLWLKEITPSNELRNWYHHNLARRKEYTQRYFAELDSNPVAVQLLIKYAQKGRVTLLYATHDIEHNHASDLREYLLSKFGKVDREVSSP